METSLEYAVEYEKLFHMVAHVNVIMVESFVYVQINVPG